MKVESLRIVAVYYVRTTDARLYRRPTDGNIYHWEYQSNGEWLRLNINDAKEIEKLLLEELKFD